jgi:hypothetical protein
MSDNAELIARLRDFIQGIGPGLDFADITKAADALELCGASLSQCETRREALEAENTFLQQEIEAAAHRQKALLPRENESGEGQ